ncbi:MAG TPA: glycerophosphodiester phosphodiesterase family protein [Dehalococcoidia bacterium]|nr:glycerophosphodiester phosphodiesterase family protein [Dehalococcoidia bacterium]
MRRTLFHRPVKQSTGEPPVEQVREVTVVAHRGGRFDAPNTLIGIKKAINYAQLNPDIRFMIEVDVQQCKPVVPGAPGQLVVIHDSSVNLTTTARGKVSRFTLDELKSLTIKPPKEVVPLGFLESNEKSETWLFPTPEADRRIPSLQEVLDLVDAANDYRHARVIPLIGIGIDFTHVASRMGRFKDHVGHPFLEKVNSGSQLHKVSAPEPLLNQLAQEICMRKGRTPIQLISQGVHGSRHLGMLIRLIEGSAPNLSIAVQASTSLFPADSRDVKSAMALDEAKLGLLVSEGRFTINYNHRWDRLATYLQRLTGSYYVNPFCLVSDRFAVSNREAMRQAQEDGFLTGFWTVNCPDAIRDVILWGANMVTTDYPPRVAAFIRDYGPAQGHEETNRWRPAAPAAVGSAPARPVPSGRSNRQPTKGEPSINEEGALRGA